MSKPEKKQQFIELRAVGISFEKISKQIGVSKPTLIKWNPELQPQIRQAREQYTKGLQEEIATQRLGFGMILLKKLEQLYDSILPEKYNDLKTMDKVILATKIESLLTSMTNVNQVTIDRHKRKVKNLDRIDQMIIEDIKKVIQVYRENGKETSKFWQLIENLRMDNEF